MTTDAAAKPARKSVQIFGPYKLLKTIGEGEFGKVKLAAHATTLNKVAIKLIKKESIVEESKKTKLMREISILQTLSHPHIVKLLQVIETDVYIGMVLEYISGGELFDYILKHKYLKDSESRKYFAQLLSGVHYMHYRNIVHRDLKLENLLLDGDRNLVITDFGFANRVGSQERLLLTSCGSPCYAAPELVIGEGYSGEAADIWSCGVILYAMLCGYLPFDDDPANPDGENINLLYKYILETELTFPEYVSSEGKSLLRMMLVPDPKKRASFKTILSHPWLLPVRHIIDDSIKKYEKRSSHAGTVQNSTGVFLSGTGPLMAKRPMSQGSSVVDKSKATPVGETPVWKTALVQGEVSSRNNPSATAPVNSPNPIVDVTSPASQASLATQTSPVISKENENGVQSAAAPESIGTPDRSISPTTMDRATSKSENLEERNPHFNTSPARFSQTQPPVPTHSATGSTGEIEYYNSEEAGGKVKNGGNQDIANWNSHHAEGSQSMKSMSIPDTASRSSKKLPPIPSKDSIYGSRNHSFTTPKNSETFERQLKQQIQAEPARKSFDIRKILKNSSENEPTRRQVIQTTAPLRVETQFTAPLASGEDSAPLNETDTYDRKSFAYSRKSYATSFGGTSQYTILQNMYHQTGKLPKMRYQKGPIDRRALTSKDPMLLILDMEKYFLNNGYNVVTDSGKNFLLKVVRPDTMDGCSDKRSILNVSQFASFPVSFLKRLAMRAKYGSAWDKGYDGKTNKSPLFRLEHGGQESPQRYWTEIKFSVEVRKIKNLDLFVVDFKRLKGDIWEFKRMYEELIVDLPIDRKY